MMICIREAMLRKDQKGLAVVEYVIVLAVVAALAFAVFGGTGNDALSKALTTKATDAVKKIQDIK